MSFVLIVSPVYYASQYLVKLSSIFILLGLWFISSVSVVAQQASLTPEEDRWLTLVLAMATADPELREEASAFQSLSRTERQQVLQKAKALVHTFTATRVLKAERRSSSKVVLHPRVYIDDATFLPKAFKKLTELEYEPTNQAVELRFKYTSTPDDHYQLAVEHTIPNELLPTEQADQLVAQACEPCTRQPTTTTKVEDTGLLTCYQAFEEAFLTALGQEPVTNHTIDPVILAYLEQKFAELSQTYQEKIIGFVYCKICEEEPPATELQHTELTLNSSQETLSGETVAYGHQRCLKAFYRNNSSEATEAVSGLQVFDQNEYSNQQHLTAFVNVDPGTLPCTDYLTLGSWDYCSQEVDQAVADALLSTLAQCVEEEGIFTPEPSDTPDASQLAQRLNEPVSDEEKIKVVNSEGQEVARSPGLAPNQSEHFTVTVDADNQLSVKLAPDYLNSLGQTDPGVLAALEQAFNDLLRQAKVSFCTGDNRSSDCTDQQLVFLQVLSLNVQSIALEAQLHPAMWDSQDTKSNLISSNHSLPPIATGVADALVERVSDLPQLALMAGGLIINNDHQREALAGIFTAEGWQMLKAGVFAELAATIRQEDKREHAIATASVNLIVGFYALLSYGPKLIAQLTDKIQALAKKVEQAPNLAKYLKKIVQEAPSADLAKKLEQLLDNMDAAVLERLLARLPEEKLDDLVTDLADNNAFRDALAKNEGLVDSWRKLDDLGTDIVPDAMRRNPDFLKKFDDVVNNDGLNKHVFSGNISYEILEAGQKKWKVGGVHHKTAFENGTARIKSGTKSTPDINGYYTAKVEVYHPEFPDNSGFKVKSKESTFFPDSWSVDKVQAEIAGAIKNKGTPNVFPDGRKLYKATMTDGTDLAIWEDATGNITSTYPVL